MKTTAIAAVLAAAALFAGCAHAPVTAAVPPSAPCQATPQWILNDPAGKPVNAVFICFGSKGELLYATRPLTPEQLAALTPKAAAVPKAKPAKRAQVQLPATPAALGGSGAPDACAELDGEAYTKCRIAQHAASAPGEGLKAVK